MPHRFRPQTKSDPIGLDALSLSGVFRVLLDEIEEPFPIVVLISSGPDQVEKLRPGRTTDMPHEIGIALLENAVALRVVVDELPDDLLGPAVQASHGAHFRDSLPFAFAVTPGDAPFGSTDVGGDKAQLFGNEAGDGIPLVDRFRCSRLNSGCATPGVGGVRTNSRFVSCLQGLLGVNSESVILLKDVVRDRFADLHMSRFFRVTE